MKTSYPYTSCQATSVHSLFLHAATSRVPYLQHPPQIFFWSAAGGARDGIRALSEEGRTTKTKLPQTRHEGEAYSHHRQTVKVWSPILDLASLNPAAFSSSIGGSFTHHRRRSSTSNTPQNLNLQAGLDNSNYSSPSHSAQTLETIPGTPNLPMSLSRSPSPRPGGGWASPGLNSPYANVSGRSSPAQGYRGSNGGNSVTWESAKAKSDGINGYPSFSTQNNGFFNRHYRTISNSLPHFNLGSDKSYAEKEKLGRGRWMGDKGSRMDRVRSLVRRVSRKMKLRYLVVLALITMYILFYVTRKSFL